MKILVSDLDGTIYRNKMVSAIDLKMINDFASRNMFVIATGRNENTFSFFSQHYDLALLRPSDFVTIKFSENVTMIFLF